MALEVEGVMDGGVDAEKPLRGAGRFEALHFPLPPSHDLVRVLGTIVHPQPLLVTAGQMELPERGGIGAQLVSDRQLGRKALLLEQLAHQPHGRPFIPARLDQQIEDFALLIDGTPEVHAPAGDPRDHLVEGFSSRLSRSKCSNLVDRCRPPGDQWRPDMVTGLQIELVLVLLPHEAQVRSQRRFGDASASLWSFFCPFTKGLT